MTASKSQTDAEYSKIIADVAERDRKARLLLEKIEEELPEGLTGLVMVNADTGEWFSSKDNGTGWKEAKQKWGEDIAHPPLWTINVEKVYAKRPKKIY